MMVEMISESIGLTKSCGDNASGHDLPILEAKDVLAKRFSRVLEGPYDTSFVVSPQKSAPQDTWASPKALRLIFFLLTTRERSGLSSEAAEVSFQE